MENYKQYASKHYNKVDKLQKQDLRLLITSMKKQHIIPKTEFRFHQNSTAQITSVSKVNKFYAKMFRVSESVFTTSFKICKAKNIFYSLPDFAEDIKIVFDEDDSRVKRYSVFIDTFTNGSKEKSTLGIRVYENGKIEEGGYKNGLLNGIGRIIHPNGFTIRCEFKNGLKHGKCIESYSNCDVTGFYIKGIKHGLFESKYSFGFTSNAMYNYGNYKYINKANG